MADETEGQKSTPSKAAGGKLADDFVVKTFEDLAHLPAEELRGQLNGWLSGWQTLVAALVGAADAVLDAFMGVMDEHTKGRMIRALSKAPTKKAEELAKDRRRLGLLAGINLSGGSGDLKAFTDPPDIEALVAHPVAGRRALVQSLDSGTQRLAAALQGAEGDALDAILGAMTPDEIEMVVEQFRDRLFTEEEVLDWQESLRRSVEDGAVLAKEWEATVEPNSRKI